MLRKVTFGEITRIEPKKNAAITEEDQLKIISNAIDKVTEQLSNGAEKVDVNVEGIPLKHRGVEYKPEIKLQVMPVTDDEKDKDVYKAQVRLTIKDKKTEKVIGTASNRLSLPPLSKDAMRTCLIKNKTEICSEALELITKKIPISIIDQDDE